MAVIKNPPRITTAQRRQQIMDTDDELDRAIGRMLRWCSKVADLRARRKRLTRDLAKELAR